MANRNEAPQSFNGLHPMEDREAVFYTLLNDGDFTLQDLEKASTVLGLARVDQGLVDGQFVPGDAVSPVRRGEVIVDHQLSKEELRRLGDLGLSAKEGPLREAA